MTESITPDVSQTYLTWRVWGWQKGVLTSTTPAGVSKAEREKREAQHPLLAGLEAPLGEWAIPTVGNDGVMVAQCNARGEYDALKHTDESGLECAPGLECSCGIYAAKDLELASRYLSKKHPVFGLVELSGRVIDCEMAYRAQYARVAAILAINEALTLEHGALAKIAATYGVPLLTPTSLSAQAHREAIEEWQAAQDAEAGLDAQVAEAALSLDDEIAKLLEQGL